MNVAVKTYEHVVGKPAGIPDIWPAEVVELGDSTTLPDESGDWQLMTHEEFAAYKDAFQDQYDAWLAQTQATALQTKAWKEKLARRTEWGIRVILDFRIFVIERYMPPAMDPAAYTNIQLLSALSSVMTCLQTGLLAEAVGALSAVTTLPLVLDDWYDETQTQTVRQYFSDKILEGM